MSDEYPEPVARFYDVIYESLRSGIDRTFFLDRMAAAAGPVLEVGVGTGRMFLDALAGGADVYGIDSSDAMLQVLQQRLPSDHAHRVRRMDVRSLTWPQRFQLIVAPFRVFSHLVTVSDQLQALEAIAAHLESGGRFLFDLFAPDYSMLASPVRRRLDFDGEYEPGRTLKRFVSAVNHPGTQTNDVTMELEWDESGQTRRESWTFPMRYYFRYEIEHLVARSPLELVGIFGDYAGGAICDHSRDYIVECTV